MIDECKPGNLHERLTMSRAVPPAPGSAPRRSRLIRLLALAVLLGLAARIVRYSLDLQIHHDEAYLLNNVLVLGYGELLRPLANSQAAPPAFCWVIKSCSGLGNGEQTVRLLPFAAGLASIGLFAGLCRQTLRGSAMWFALAVFTVSHVIIVSTVRAKPYALDMFIGAVFAWLATGWMVRPRSNGPLIALAVLAPFAVWLSYPSVFVIGGVGLVLGAYVLQRHRHLPHAAWATVSTVGLLAVASFIGLYVVHIRPALAGASGAGLLEFWSDTFPPLDSLPQTLWWFVTTHTGRMYAYPVGEKMFGGTLSFILWAVGVPAVWRRPHGRWIAAALLAPQVLLLIAAFAGKYPYGGHARISLFLAPAMCLFIGAGIADLTCRLGRALRHKTRIVATALLLALPVIEMLGDVVSLVREKSRVPISAVLSDVADRASPRDRVVCVNPSKILGSGGPSRQLFEYYMERRLGERVEWDWGGTSIISTPPASLPSTGETFDLFIIACREPGDEEIERRITTLRQQWPDRFETADHQHYRILPNRHGEVDIWRMSISAPAPD